MNNTMADNLRKIAKLCELGTEAWEVAEAINYSCNAARRYLKNMEDLNILRCEQVKNTARGKPYKGVWYSLKTELTDAEIEQLTLMISKSNKDHKERFKIKADALLKAQGMNYSAQVQKELRQQEQQGIYRLNTSHSDYFIKKMKESNKQDSKEKKSPKNYAGTSAGMVW